SLQSRKRCEASRSGTDHASAGGKDAKVRLSQNQRRARRRGNTGGDWRRLVRAREQRRRRRRVSNGEQRSLAAATQRTGGQAAAEENTARNAGEQLTRQTTTAIDGSQEPWVQQGQTNGENRV